MPTYPAVGGGGVTLPLHVPAGGVLADMAANGNMLLGGGAGIANLEISVANIMRLNGQGWLASGNNATLNISRIASSAANEAVTVGAAGAAAALPAQPLGYYIIQNNAGNAVKIPFYNN